MSNIYAISFRYYEDISYSRAHSEPDLRLDERFLNMAESGGRRRFRFFLALFDYNHLMSPNPNAAQEELSFRKGQVIKVKLVSFSVRLYF